MCDVMNIFFDDVDIIVFIVELMMDVYFWDFWDVEGVMCFWIKEIIDIIEIVLVFDK